MDPCAPFGRSALKAVNGMGLGFWAPACSSFSDWFGLGHLLGEKEEGKPFGFGRLAGCFWQQMGRLECGCFAERCPVTSIADAVNAGKPAGGGGGERGRAFTARSRRLLTVCFRAVALPLNLGFSCKTEVRTVLGDYRGDSHRVFSPVPGTDAKCSVSTGIIACVTAVENTVQLSCPGL